MRVRQRSRRHVEAAPPWNRAGRLAAAVLATLAVLGASAACKDSADEVVGPLLEKEGKPVPLVVGTNRLIDVLDRARVSVPATKVKEFAGVAECRFSLLPAEYSGLVKTLAMGRADTELEVARALFAPVPSTYAFEVVVPPGAVLETGFGTGARPDGRPSSAADFQVAVVDATGERQVLMDASAEPGEPSWKRASIDLSSFEGRKVRLELVTSGRTGALGAWANPLVRVGGKPEKRRPNVVLVALDTVRADRLSLYGFGRPTSPRLEALAARGVAFENTFSNANWSRPSYFSVLTGKIPGNLGIPMNRFNITTPEMNHFHQHNKLTLPFLLSREGYRTLAVGNNHFIVQEQSREGVGRLGLDVGFEEVWNVNLPDGADSARIVERVDRFLGARAGDPFFLFVTLDNAHFPYEPRKEFREGWTTCGNCDESEEFRYLGGIAQSDAALGDIVDSLARHGLAEDTIVIAFADHGESFDPAHDFEFPRRGLGSVEWCRTRFDHGSSLYDEVLHVPLVAAGPGIVAGRRIPRQVELLGLMPTVLDLAGVDRKGLVLDGRSLAPFLAGGDDEGSPAVVSEGMDIRSLRTPDYHYILAEDVVRTVRRTVAGRKIDEDMKEQLFDVRADPDEHVNVAGERPEALASMRRLMDERCNEKLNGLHLELDGAAGDMRVYSGEVSTSGVLTRAGVYKSEAGDAVEVSMDRKRFTFTGLLQNDTDGVVFQVSPPGASITLDLKLDGKPIAKSATSMGCLGMRFPSMPLKLADARARKPLECAQAPARPARVEATSVRFWESVEPFIRTDEALDDGMKKMLKDWGYIHDDGGKKTGK